ncbi:Nicotinamide-nucleotide adenylyltransferase [Spironucleus salmonicida]|uniref:Nicotinamide-nucleotide adenylyltransferase n=1 Tax=Spironucleus salmonicida TaxID=348837 RepID=V6LW22_9EUKA|nr:Nicotinamide-nucleotide adenylyltransferase [Spironucleus salmonicida]|eukprot:EST48448.1 Nicotinamide-nucleotide adenylyltransferase [Spironucleus salmonicida]
MSVLLLPGSLNPITKAHIASLELAYNTLKNSYSIDKLIISPANSNYKQKHLVSGTHRVAMANLAIKNSIISHLFIVDDFEALESNYFVPTFQLVNHLSKKYNKKVILVGGSDLLLGMMNQNIWPEVNVRKLLNQCDLFIISRGVSVQSLKKTICQLEFLKDKLENESIILIEESVGKESSTLFRAGCLDCCFDNVVQYAHTHQLYSFESEK